MGKNDGLRMIGITGVARYMTYLRKINKRQRRYTDNGRFIKLRDKYYKKTTKNGKRNWNKNFI